MLPGGFPRRSVAIKDLPLFISMSCLKVKKTPKIRRLKTWKSWIFKVQKGSTLGVTGVVKKKCWWICIWGIFKKRSSLDLGLRQYKTNLKFPLELWTQDVSFHHPPQKTNNNTTTPHLGGWSFSKQTVLRKSQFPTHGAGSGEAVMLSARKRTMCSWQKAAAMWLVGKQNPPDLHWIFYTINVEMSTSFDV